MKNFLLLLIGCVGISILGHAQTQLELNEKAKRSAEKADKELNSVYQEIVKDYAGDTAFIRRLRVSERLWVQFRMAELDMKYPPDQNYGSIQPVCWAEYYEMLTRDRIKTLKQWVDGEEEEDSCSGSVKMKPAKQQQ